jgi:hypothetical protein
MRRKDLLKVEELEKLSDRELIKMAAQSWDHLKRSLLRDWKITSTSWRA